MAFPGKVVADRLGLDRGQNAVCDAISAFRKKLTALLAENGFTCNDDTIIMSGKSGYQLNPGLTVDDQTHQASRKTKEELGESPADRQEWILAELHSGRKLRRKDLEKQFGISTATAKRDFTLLDDRVAFTGTGAAGHYVLRA
jgi:Fic family protein